MMNIQILTSNVSVCPARDHPGHACLQAGRRQEGGPTQTQVGNKNQDDDLHVDHHQGRLMCNIAYHFQSILNVILAQERGVQQRREYEGEPVRQCTEQFPSTGTWDSIISSLKVFNFLVPCFHQQSPSPASKWKQK